jgi:hypothetical protein
MAPRQMIVCLRGRHTTGPQSEQVFEGKRGRLAFGSSCATISRPDRADPGVYPLPGSAKHSMGGEAAVLGCNRPKNWAARNPSTPLGIDRLCPGKYEMGIGALPLRQRCRWRWTPFGVCDCS